MPNQTQSHSSDTGFFGLLAILFIALKLFDVIAWSWWWVLAPLWIPATIALVVIVVIAAAVWAKP